MLSDIVFNYFELLSAFNFNQNHDYSVIPTIFDKE